MYDPKILTYIKVAETGSFASAAEALLISPAAVKKQIDALEAMCKVQLLERTNRGIKLTSAGNYIYSFSKHIVSRTADTIATAQQIASTTKKVIRIGSSAMRPCRPFLKYLTGINPVNLSFNFEIVPFDDSEIPNLSSMFENDFDCLTTSFDADSWNASYCFHQISEFKCEIGAPLNHPLAQRSYLTWDDLIGQKLILVRKGKGTFADNPRTVIEEKYPSISIIDEPGFYNFDTFNKAEKEGCLIETLDVWDGLHPFIKNIPMEWDFSVPFGIVYPKSKRGKVEQLIAEIEPA